MPAGEGEELVAHDETSGVIVGRLGELQRLSRNPKLRCLHVPSGKNVQFLTSSL